MLEYLPLRAQDREPWGTDSPHKGSVTPKMFHLMTSSWRGFKKLETLPKLSKLISTALVINHTFNKLKPDNQRVHELGSSKNHDDVIKWKHSPRYWPFVRGIYRLPVDSPSQRPVTRMFYLICAWTNGWVHNRDAGDLRRQWTHYDVTVMDWSVHVRSFPT